ncbi:MAG: metal ABC transporter permease [Spirochaetales bacterium]|nr:metal ABC transporter permease [Spirochaetales bacterium]
MDFIVDPGIVTIAVFVAAACAIPGVFLVLRKMALMSDAISHAVLPGIVLGFLISGNSHGSPLIILGAVFTGMLTVVLTEALVRTRLVRNDTAMGIVFPALFSIGVILVGLFASNAHIDADAVFQGDLVIASLNSFSIGGLRLGPVSAWIMGIIFVVNLVLVLLFFKELKISTFDPGLAAAAGFAPTLIHYALMIDVSVTAVGAFDAVGSILVVALMIAPAAAAYLVTDDLKKMILLSILIGVISSLAGYIAAVILDVNISGSMAGFSGIAFLLAFLFSPKRGMVSIMNRRKQQKLDFAVAMLAVHLLHHRGSKNEESECRIDHLQRHINWSRRFAADVISEAGDQGIIRQSGELLGLTADGERIAVEAMSK